MDFQRERIQENEVKKRRICKLKAQEILTGNNGARYFRCHTNLAGIRGTWRKALWCHSKQVFDQTTCQFYVFYVFMLFCVFYVLHYILRIARIPSDWFLPLCLVYKTWVIDLIQSIYNIWDWCQYAVKVHSFCISQWIVNMRQYKVYRKQESRPKPESHRSTRTPIPTRPGPLTSGVYACS